jgi:hypothetical protein
MTADQLDAFIDPEVGARHKAAEYAIGYELLQTHGPTAFAAPRDLTVAHETGHVIVAALAGVTIGSVEVECQSVAKVLGVDAARKAAALGFPALIRFRHFIDGSLALASLNLA